MFAARDRKFIWGDCHAIIIRHSCRTDGADRNRLIVAADLNGLVITLR
jgi:hypothetical protein